jgi:serine/threonine protein kinase
MAGCAGVAAGGRASGPLAEGHIASATGHPERRNRRGRAYHLRVSERNDSAPPGPLPEGYVLNGFVIGKVIGVGGFSIVYEAWDPKVEREIAIKEYMPTSLATRSDTQHVTLLSRANQDTFEIGLRSFVNEARLLGQLDHECLVKVYQFWEENGTAYMVMPRYRARTLKAVRSEMKQAPREAWLRGVLDPVLSVLERLHGQGVFHRDIAPDNIMLREDGRPIVLDFGAARKVITGRSQMLTAILKPHYAPVEQYAETPGLRQGPWTDLYAVGATMRYLITGEPPMPATARVMGDDDPPLASLSFPGISQTLLRTIDAMLIPQPQKRPASVQAVRDLLDGQEGPAAPAADSEATVLMPARSQEHTVIPDRPVRTVPSPRTQPQARPATPSERRTQPPATEAAPQGTQAAAASPEARRAFPGVLMAAGLALAFALAGAAWWLGTRASGADSARETVAQAPVAGVAATSPPTQPTVSATATPSVPAPELPAASASPVAPATVPATVPTIVPPAPAVPAPANAGVSPPAPSAAPVRPTPQPTQKPEGSATPKPREAPATAAAPRPVPVPVPVPGPRTGPQDAGQVAATRPGTPVETSRTPPPSPRAPETVTATAPAAPLDPNTPCGGRMFIARDNCLRRQCALVDYAGHSECARVRGICELPAHASVEECKQIRATWLRMQGRS